jgi:hypothetical protein
MLQGRFAQMAEFLSIALILIGIVALCQPWFFPLFRIGFGILLTGWVGLTVFSHRKPVRAEITRNAEEGHTPVSYTNTR